MRDLRTVRQSRGLTVYDLCSCMLRTATVIEIETGKRIPRRNTRKKLESIVGPVDWRATFGAGGREHLIHSLSEFISEGEPGVRQRIKYAKQALQLIEETFNV